MGWGLGAPSPQLPCGRTSAGRLIEVSVHLLRETRLRVPITTFWLCDLKEVPQPLWTLVSSSEKWVWKSSADAQAAGIQGANGGSLCLGSGHGSTQFLKPGEGHSVPPAMVKPSLTGLEPKACPH